MAKEYSCVKRTKRSFEHSLAALAKDRPLSKITVKMLCEHAQLSRNAFYFHYQDINSLVSEIEDSIVEEAIANLDGFKEMGFPKNVRATIVALIELIDSRRDVCHMLLENSEDFTERMGRAYCDFFYQYFCEYHKTTDDRTGYDFFYMFVSSGFYGLIKYWLDNPDKMSKNELVGLTYVLVKRLLVMGNPEIDVSIPKEKNK